MQFIKEEKSYIYEEKKSKFIAYITPYSNFESLMNSLKNEHTKARHFVYAYRYLNEFKQIVENSSDDGEPRGTSGRPSLAVLAGAELINSAVIIVRYFGGVKLGTGGLVRAYSDAVNLVISTSELFIYEELLVKKLLCPYSSLSKIEYLCEQNGVFIEKRVFEREVILDLKATNERFVLFKNNLPSNLKLI